MTLFRFVILIIGSVLTLLYIILMLAGKKYDSLIEGLPKEGYSDKELYAAGFKLEELPMFSDKSAIGQRMQHEALLLHPENEGRYARYWAKLYLARTLSLTMMVAAGFCGAAGMLSDPIMMALALVAGAACVYVVYDSGINGMKKELQKRSDACLMEFSNMVSKLSLLLNCDMTLHDAWFAVAGSKEGPLYDMMRRSCDEMNNGVGDINAIYDFGVLCNVQEIKKFSSILIQSITKGGSDITIYLRQQSQELWNEKKQILLRKGDEANAQLLMPTMMFMVGIIAIVVSAAMSGMQLGF